MADRYLELIRHTALIQPGAADALLDYIEALTKAHGPSDRTLARAFECGQLRGTARNLIAHICELHADLKSAAVDGACNAWVDEHGERIKARYGIDIEAEHAAQQAPEDEPDYFGQRRAA